MVDNLVPLPVVVERLHDQRDQDDTPEAEAEVGKADIGAEKRQDAEEDETEGVRQAVHRCDKTGRIAMACHEVDGKGQHKEYGALDREIMAQPSHNGNADCREDGYPCDAQKKAAGHRLRIEGPHQVAIARDVGRLNRRHISAEHAV